jgi:hypothetical protein
MDYMIDHPQLASLWAANSRTIARKMGLAVGTVHTAALLICDKKSLPEN